MTDDENNNRIFKNEERACSVDSAIEQFQREKYNAPNAKKDLEEDLGDLICNILHNAQMNGLDPLKIASFGIGAFTAENRSPDGEPAISNDNVEIKVKGHDGFTQHCV